MGLKGPESRHYSLHETSRSIYRPTDDYSTLYLGSSSAVQGQGRQVRWRVRYPTKVERLDQGKNESCLTYMRDTGDFSRDTEKGPKKLLCVYWWVEKITLIQGPGTWMETLQSEMWVEGGQYLGRNSRARVIKWQWTRVVRQCRRQDDCRETVSCKGGLIWGRSGRPSRGSRRTLCVCRKWNRRQVNSFAKDV